MSLASLLQPPADLRLSWVLISEDDLLLTRRLSKCVIAQFNEQKRMEMLATCSQIWQGEHTNAQLHGGALRQIFAESTTMNLPIRLCLDAQEREKVGLNAFTHAHPGHPGTSIRIWDGTIRPVEHRWPACLKRDGSTRLHRTAQMHVSLCCRSPKTARGAAQKGGWSTKLSGCCSSHDHDSAHRPSKPHFEPAAVNHGKCAVASAPASAKPTTAKFQAYSAYLHAVSRGEGRQTRGLPHLQCDGSTVPRKKDEAVVLGTQFDGCPEIATKYSRTRHCYYIVYRVYTVPHPVEKRR